MRHKTRSRKTSEIILRLFRVEEFKERVALVDFATGTQLTFGQARHFAR